MIWVNIPSPSLPFHAEICNLSNFCYFPGSLHSSLHWRPSVFTEPKHLSAQWLISLWRENEAQRNHLHVLGRENGQKGISTSRDRKLPDHVKKPDARKHFPLTLSRPLPSKLSDAMDSMICCLEVILQIFCTASKKQKRSPYKVADVLLLSLRVRCVTLSQTTCGMCGLIFQPVPLFPFLKSSLRCHQHHLHPLQLFHAGPWPMMEQGTKLQVPLQRNTDFLKEACNLTERLSFWFKMV